MSDIEKENENKENVAMDICKPSSPASSPITGKSEKLNINQLPEEVMMFMFLHLDDTDLQTMAKVSIKMHRLATDVILWKKFRQIKNPALLSNRLLSLNRPDRYDLVQMNVLRGVHPHQITSGQYINSPTVKTLHENQAKVSWLLREQLIRNRLDKRPDSIDLEKRGVLPVGITNQVNSPVSPLIMAKAVDLKNSFKQAVLNRKLRRRLSVSEVGPNVMKGMSSTSTVAPSLIATKIELERQFHERDLEHKINNRPTIDQVETRISHDPSETALLVCPGVKPKIRTFESLKLQSQKEHESQKH